MTTVRSVVSDRFIRIDDNLPREVCISLGSEIVDLDRAEFLAAVATELDVIVIDRADLPEVWVENGRAYSGREANELYSSSLDGNPNWSGNYALAALAVHEHIKARPPVDEAQVDALARALAVEAQVDALARALAVVDEQGEHAVNLYRDQARRLIRAGVRAPQAGDDQ